MEISLFTQNFKGVFLSIALSLSWLLRLVPDKRVVQVRGGVEVKNAHCLNVYGMYEAQCSGWCTVAGAAFGKWHTYTAR